MDQEGQSCFHDILGSCYFLYTGVDLKKSFILLVLTVKFSLQETAFGMKVFEIH